MLGGFSSETRANSSRCLDSVAPSSCLPSSLLPPQFSCPLGDKLQLSAKALKCAACHLNGMSHEQTRLVTSIATGLEPIWTDGHGMASHPLQWPRHGKHHAMPKGPVRQKLLKCWTQTAQLGDVVSYPTDWTNVRTEPAHVGTPWVLTLLSLAAQNSIVLI